MILLLNRCSKIHRRRRIIPDSYNCSALNSRLPQRQYNSSPKRNLLFPHYNSQKLAKRRITLVTQKQGFPRNQLLISSDSVNLSFF
jgi:hypothetical protein